MSKRILITAKQLDPAGSEIFKSAGYETLYADNAEEIAFAISNWQPHGIVSRTLDLTAEMIASSTSVRVIAKHGVGVNNIDIAAASQARVPVFSTPGANSLAVAEYTIALMFAATRQIARFDREVRAGIWNRHGNVRQLAGMTLALVGYGRIARRVARIAASMGMHVIAYDPFADSRAASLAGVNLIPTLDAMLLEADIVSLHCPMEHGAPPLLDYRRLQLLQKGSFVINTARGELIDETALVSALSSGHLAGAGLDTFVNEPLAKNSALSELPNVVLSPHIGGSTPEALAAMASGAASAIVSYLEAAMNNKPIPEDLWLRCVNAQSVRTLNVRLSAANESLSE